MTIKWKITLGVGLLASALIVFLAASTGVQPDVVAKVGDVEITKAELVEKASSALAALKQQEYDVLKAALDQTVDQLLLESAAKKEGKSVDEYVDEKINRPVAEPTSEEVEKFFDANRARLQGRSLEQSKGQIAQYLRGQRQQEQYSKVIGELKTATPVVMMLEPPRVEVSMDDDPAVGPESAPVTIISFSDYECPYCSRAETVVKQVLENYKESVRVVFRDYPLDFHKNAEKAAEAAGCAHEQGKFVAMHDKLFENQKALGEDQLVSYAEQIGLEMNEFRECLGSGRRTEEVRADLRDGQLVGVSGTPAFFVNGRMLTGAQPFDAFAKVIDEELARLKN